MSDDYDAAANAKGCYDVAIDAMRKQLEDKRKKFGPDHPQFKDEPVQKPKQEELL